VRLTQGITVATYNIHRCLGTDRQRNPERVGEVIAELGVDLVGIQEIDGRRQRRHSTEQLAHLARATGTNAARGGLMHGPKGEMATALLTRHPIRNLRPLNLNPADRDPRGAVDADVEIGGVLVRVIVAHLGLRVAERQRQVVELCRVLGERPQDPVVIMGDFNEWHLHRSTLMPLDERFGAATPVPSFPSRFPMLSLDRIWAGPGAAIEAVRVHRTPLARRASDHLPVRATIRWHGA
jgi:endonuclease/exonuclease/phosphatase family metal-dependent hydrolase